MSKPVLIACRAAGGFLRHLRPKGKNAALCGHSPQNTRKMSRATWYSDMVVIRNCTKCFQKAAKLELTLPPMIGSDVHQTGDGLITQRKEADFERNRSNSN